MLFNETIVPFEGTDSIKLYQSIDSVKKFFANESVEYREEIWSSESETVPNPWNVLVIDGLMSLFFAANGKLFKIVFWNTYPGTLPNGIHTGMTVSEAKTIDASLKYDDWNEDYESSDGYWIEDDTDTNKVISITIYISEILDEEHFDYCKW